MNSVLVLNADYRLLEVVSWKQAVSLLVLEKVRMVESYADRYIRSVSTSIPWPAVVVRTTYVEHQRSVKFSRKNIVARDRYTCQYCGKKPRKSGGTPDLDDLTLDHVVPRAQSRGGWVHLPWDGKRVRITSWENVTTACQDCNHHKADRTPSEAKMKLRRRPRAPNTYDVVWMSLFQHQIPEEWKEYLPTGSPWADYWDGELQPD